MSSSWLVRTFLTWKAWVVVDEAEKEGSRTLDLRGLFLESLPTNLIGERRESLEKNLFRLLLSYNQMSTIPGEFLHFLPHLRSLSLAHNVLRDLPKSFTSLENLTRLNLSHNNFSSCGLPSVICSLRNLRILWANSVLVDKIPREINQLEKLKTLGLRFNLIAELSLFVGGSVNRIFLSHNRFLAVPIFPFNTTLVYVNLDDNKISRLESAESDHFFFPLRRLQELRYLSLKRNFLRVDVKLLVTLNKLPKLVWCRLHGNPRDSVPKDQSALEYRPSDHRVYLPDSMIESTPNIIIKNEEDLISLKLEVSNFPSVIIPGSSESLSTTALEGFHVGFMERTESFVNGENERPASPSKDVRSPFYVIGNPAHELPLRLPLSENGNEEKASISKMPDASVGFALTISNDILETPREVGDLREDGKIYGVGGNLVKTSIQLQQQTSRDEASVVRVQNWLQQLPPYNRGSLEGHYDIRDGEVPSTRLNVNPSPLQFNVENELALNDGNDDDLLASNQTTSSRDLDHASLEISPTSSEIDLEDCATSDSEISFEVDASISRLCTKYFLTV